MSKQKEYMEIPKEIKLDIRRNIIFNDGKQILWEDNGEFAVSSNMSGWKSKTKKFVLIPCDFEDLAVGDTAFRKIIFNRKEHFKDIHYYCKILSGKRYVFITDEFDGKGEFIRELTYVNDTPYKQWYKVVKREEVLK